jgi:hypothetical protein
MAVAGEGTLLGVGTTSTTANITALNSVKLGAIEQAQVDTFSLGSSVKSSRASKIPDPGSLSFSIYYDPSDTQHALLFTNSTTAADLYWKVTTIDGEEFTFQGYIRTFELNGMEVDSNVTADVEVKITTAITQTDPA